MSEKADRRLLTKKEIKYLTDNGCSAGNWNDVAVAEDFRPGAIMNVRFAGKVFLGNNILIRNVSDCIANYTIGDGVTIIDIRSLISCGQSSFGNGVGVAAVNENGGRSIPIYEGLSAQLAYIMAMYRHDKLLIEKLEQIATEIASQKISDQGAIGEGVQICNCDVIRNVNIGPRVRLEGVSRLENGTILSDPDAPTFVGTDVIAKDFIFAEGAKVADATRLKRCFVGQGVRLENGFSATDSVFFANSHFEQGEACSIFAGPFTVSHHKSTLLIAGMYSFYNAGSGTNQSNHMYKLGPGHQGVLERGCKTGSESHLIWPVRLGAFTIVIGKHSKRVDLSNLPFSVLLERQGRSELYVGLNLTNIGLVRDGQKWPQRDNRRTQRIADQINTADFTPYTAQKMLAGIELLKELEQKHAGADNVLYHGVSIRTPARGIELYQLALDQYFGDVLMRRMELIFEANGQKADLGALKEALAREIDLGQSGWADIAGLVAPKAAVSDLLDDIRAGRIDQIPMAAERFAAMAQNYLEYEWAWVAHQLEQQRGKSIGQWQGDDIKAILTASLEASEKLTALQIEDAAKEFDLSSRIGYGMDGDADTQAADFTAVCGNAESNATIQNLKEQLERKKELIEKIIREIF